jgi:Universal stress protein family
LLLTRKIVGLALELGVRLVVGSRSLDEIRRALMGSLSNSVVRYAHCPALVVRSGPHLTEEAKTQFSLIKRACYLEGLLLSALDIFVLFGH